MNISRKKVYFGLGIFIAVGLLFYSILQQRLERQEKLNTSLKPNESRKLVKKGNKLTLTRRDKDGREIKKVIKGTRDFSVTEDDKGRVEIYAPNKGWVFEPGLALGISDEVRYGADLQFFYWNNFGIAVNLLTNSDFSIRTGIVGLYDIYSNTSLFVGVDNKKDITFGIRVRL